MPTGTQATVRSLRMDAAEAKRRIESGEQATIVDVRSPQAWDSSNVKIVGAVRADAHHFRPDTSWPKDRLTLVYCT